MKSILQVTLCLLTISYTLSGATYTIFSGLTQDILDISGQAHPYSGPNLSAYVNAPDAFLVYADLTDADLTGADLSGAILSRADLTDARFFDADLSYANFYSADLTGASLPYADLSVVNFRSADLTGASLLFADLDFANLVGADLTGANLVGADLFFANFTGADLTGADLFFARYADTAIWTNSNLYGATLPIGYNQAWFEEEGAIFEETVPEPSSYALLLGSLALGLVALRRQ